VTDHYNQAELANLYDDENVWDPSSDFYRDLALRAGAKTLLDLGCGTGLLTRGIVRAIGGSGVGVDPATPMLDVARRKTRDERIEWIEGDGRTIRLGRKFDLVIMTGNAFQAFLTEADQIALFRTAAAHLAPDGRFAFESRNPARQEWLEWMPGPSFRVQETVDYGPVEIWNEATMNPGNILDVVEHYRILSSGKRLKCAFCPDCGGRLWHEPESGAEWLTLKGGSLDTPPDLSHAIHIWTSRKLPGVIIPPGALQYPEEPV
jgi:SAM-dependent methyltransferase